MLSFVKNHSIRSASVAAYPALASMISTKALPVSRLEELFEASKQNPTLQNELESHIDTYLNSLQPASPHNKASI